MSIKKLFFPPESNHVYQGSNSYLSEAEYVENVLLAIWLKYHLYLHFAGKLTLKDTADGNSFTLIRCIFQTKPIVVYRAST